MNDDETHHFEILNRLTKKNESRKCLCVCLYHVENEKIIQSNPCIGRND